MIGKLEVRELIGESADQPIKAFSGSSELWCRLVPDGDFDAHNNRINETNNYLYHGSLRRINTRDNY